MEAVYLFGILALINPFVVFFLHAFVFQVVIPNLLKALGHSDRIHVIFLMLGLTGVLEISARVGHLEVVLFFGGQKGVEDTCLLYRL